MKGLHVYLLETPMVTSGQTLIFHVYFSMDENVNDRRKMAILVIHSVHIYMINTKSATSIINTIMDHNLIWV